MKVATTIKSVISLKRPEEGKILSAEEIEQIGYKFQLLTRVK